MDLMSSLPAAKANFGLTEVPVEENVYFTYSDQRNEKELFRELNGRLGHLEAVFDIEREELDDIRQEADGFRLHTDEQQEVLRRVDWLDRLYQVKVQIAGVKTPDQAAKLGALLAPVQHCSIKRNYWTNCRPYRQNTRPTRWTEY